jgi:hypothetical protein
MHINIEIDQTGVTRVISQSDDKPPMRKLIRKIATLIYQIDDAVTTETAAAPEVHDLSEFV